MQIVETEIAEVKRIVPVRHGDSRGYFSEVFREETLARHGIAVHFVQENQSLSAQVGVVRGLHFQIPPMAQAKLVRVIKGAILDVAVDIRRGSPTYGRHVAATLTADGGEQLFIPEGFAHGFCTLTGDAEVVYKVNRYYSPENDRGLLWNDPALGINWPLPADGPLLSDKDKRHPPLAELPACFVYG